ncbi:MAG: cysteine desulfurase family protein [Bacteroidota bacterium]
MHLQTKVIYFDYNATTPVDKRVFDAMTPYFLEKFGNASSKTHAFGWQADEAVKNARQITADFIGAEVQEILFTSGATESLNLAINGLFSVYHKTKNHIVVAKTEHNAVLETCKLLEEKGATITYLSVDRYGLVDANELEKVITDKTLFVAIMLVNNETGVIQPIEQLAEITHKYGAFFVCDTTQAIGKIRVDVNELGIDLACISAHKLYGPKGIGALYFRRKNPRVNLFPIITGGGQERGLRAGTINVPGIVGLAKAIEIAESELWENASIISKLRTRLEQYLIDCGDVTINGSTRDRIFNTSSLCFKGIKAERLIAKVSGIAFSTGSACTSALAEPSHVLKAMGLTDEEAYASVRLSLGKYNTDIEVRNAIDEISKAVKELRGN